MNFLIQNQNNGVITLKEITDILEVRHDKAKLKVDELIKEPDFGEVSKMDTFNLNNVKVETYLLTKKQAIIVGAKLNNSLLIKLVNKLEEIESKNKPLELSKIEGYTMSYEGMKRTGVLYDNLDYLMNYFDELLKELEKWKLKTIIQN